MSVQVVNIKGMTCGHCEGRVTAELIKIDGVTQVKASAPNANATIESETEIDNQLIESAVRAAGYSIVI